MAQYYTEFSEYADTAALDAEWTKRLHTEVFSTALATDAGVTGGKYLEMSQTTSDRAALSWNNIDADAGRDELDFLLRIRTADLGTGQIGAFGRGSGTSTSENGYVGQFSTNDETFRFAKYVNAAFTNMGTGGSSSLNTWYWVRVQMLGSSLRLRAWTGAVGDEPGAWAIDTTDSSITAAGWVGLFSFNNGTHDCDVFAVGTAGDPAPTGPQPTLETPTGLIVGLTTANSITWGWDV